MNEEGKKTRAEYHREWNRKNRDKVRAAQERYWERKAAAEAAQDQQTGEPTQNRKERRTYTEQETEEILKTMKTSGHKGVKLPRINLAFAPDVYKYIQTMSRVRGETMTDFVNTALRQHMEDHEGVYEKAIEFRNSSERKKND